MLKQEWNALQGLASAPFPLFTHSGVADFKSDEGVLEEDAEAIAWLRAVMGLYHGITHSWKNLTRTA